jgi:two-component system, NtrC family, sensor histidine kinase HydH
VKHSTRARAAGMDPLETAGRLLMADAEHAVLLLDPRGRVASANPAALRLLGVRGAVRGKAAATLVRTVVPGDDPVAETYRATTTERELLLAAPGGGEVPVLLRGFRFGRPPQVLLVLRDLTQPRRMQQELRRHERLATLGQLSAGVAHEIRNPLAGIGTSAQVLLRRFEPRDERARFVRVILDEVARLDRLVTNLLQYARPRTPELKPGRLADCVSRVMELSADSFAQAGVRAEFQAAPGAGPLWIDSDLVTQVLLNVTLNAVQAMPQGGTLRYEVRRTRRRRAPRGPGRRAVDTGAGAGPGPALRTRASRGYPAAPAAEAGGWFAVQQIRVTDSGTGIPRGTLAKLFDPFFSTKPRGSGLGLSICQTIMQEHGGSIEVASREGRGTTVLLDFPVEKRNGERRGTGAGAGLAHPAHR